jgi:hypothetical protein
MVTKWIHSKEKENLKDDIINGVVSETMHAREVYEMRNGSYHKFPYHRFQDNLKNLRKAIQMARDSAREDEIAFGNVMREWPRQEEAGATRTYPPWHNSRAKALLLEDIEAGIIDGYCPSIVRQTRPEYMEYPPQVFRDHLNKEKKKPEIKAYWEHQRALAKAKKQGREK